MKNRILAILVAAIIANLSSIQSVAQELERGWTPVREDLELFLDPNTESLRIHGTITARLEHTDSTRDLVLALNSRDSLFRFTKVNAVGAESDINLKHPDREVTIISQLRFEEEKKRGDEVQISFTCESKLEGKQFVVNAEIALASWVEAWYPFLLPRDGVSLSSASKISGTTTFHLPLGWHAVSNGALISSENVGDETIEIWETEIALSRSFAAGPYDITRERRGDLDVSLYLLSKDIPNPGAHVESLSMAIEAMEQHWGDYPYPSYAIVEVPSAFGDFGASSEQGFIMVKPHFLKEPTGNLPLFAHEASHGWWGNTVGSKGPGSLLCTESLAQYGAVIAAERVWGPSEATDFLRFSRAGYVPSQCARGYFSLVRNGQDKALSTLISGGATDHTLADAKGHWVYHMLRKRVGDEVFFGTLRGLIEDYRGKEMELDDIRAAFLEAAPDFELETFFSQWLDRTGAPVLESSWQQADDTLTVKIQQLQKGEPFEFKLKVAIESTEGQTQIEEIFLSGKSQSFVFKVVSQVQSLSLDPQHEVLIWDEEYGPVPEALVPAGETEILPEEQLQLYTGEYHIADINLMISISSAAGHLVATIGGGDADELVPAGEHRFRANNGFIEFTVEKNTSSSLHFFRDGGGERLAARVQ